MKNCFIAIVLFLTGVLAAADAAVLRFAPNSTVAVVEFNLARLMKHPDMTAALNAPESLAKRQEIEKATGVKLSDFKQAFIFVTAQGETVFVAKLDKLFDIEQVFHRNKVPFKKVRIAGKDVLQLTKPVRNGKIIQVAVLAPGIILAGEKGDIAKYFSLKRGNVSISLKKVLAAVPGNVPVWLAFANVFKDPQGKINDPQSLYFTFDFAGKSKRDYALHLMLNCSDAKKTQEMAAVVPMYLNMGLSMAINDPSLSQDLLACFKTTVNGGQISVSAVVTEDLGKKISAYFKTHAANLLGASGEKKGGNPPAPRKK